MSLLNVCRLSFRYPSTPELFRDAAFTIETGDRLAIVGANGVRKTTLLRLLAGELQQSGGSIVRRKGLRAATAHQQRASRLTARAVTMRFVHGVRSPSGRRGRTA